MKKAVFLLILMLFIAYCFPAKEPCHFKGIAMTMPYHIQIGALLSDQEKKVVEQTIHDIFEKAHQTYNKFNTTSELSKLNQAKAKIPYTLSQPLYHLFLQTEKLWYLTEKKFDPTVETIKQGASHHVGFQYVTLSPYQLEKKFDDLAFDLGGIAKGATIDHLIEALKDLGFSNAIVEWGGDFRAMGMHPTGRFWKVTIQNPFHPHQRAMEIELKNQAIATSGDYLQYWENEDGTIAFHIIDPATKRPRLQHKGSIASASILANTCLEADALATALMLFDSEDQATAWLQEVQKAQPEVEGYFFKRV